MDRRPRGGPYCSKTRPPCLRAYVVIILSDAKMADRA